MSVFVCLLLQAWLTEIHEYAQSNVVIMLLGNKVGGNCLRSLACGAKSAKEGYDLC